MQWDPLNADWYVVRAAAVPDVGRFFLDAEARIVRRRAAPDTPQTEYGAYETYCLLMLGREIRVSVMSMGKCQCLATQAEYFVNEKGEEDLDMYSRGSPQGYLGRYVVERGFVCTTLAVVKRRSGVW